MAEVPKASMPLFGPPATAPTGSISADDVIVARTPKTQSVHPALEAAPVASNRSTSTTKDSEPSQSIHAGNAMGPPIRAKIGPTEKAHTRDAEAQAADAKESLIFTGTFAGGLRADLARRAPWYFSDWIEAFTKENRSQAIASVIFLFFACLSPAVTFGMLFDEYTEGQLGVVEMILSSGISGVLYAFFSGQPLCILGATGPELAYTAVFFSLCKTLELEFLPARVWQGLWTALFTVLLSLFDLCALMKYVTRFTEEIFSALISVIFIYEALLNVGKLYFADDSILGRARAFSGTVFALGTYGFAMLLKNLKGGKQFTPTVRKLFANYAVIVSIVTFTFLNWLFRDVGNATLQVPETIEPTYIDPVTNATRPWIVNPMGVHKPFPAWGIAFTALPALGLTLLGYMDQNLTSLLINRKDHNLKKPPGYHLVRQLPTSPHISPHLPTSPARILPRTPAALDPLATSHPCVPSLAAHPEAAESIPRIAGPLRVWPLRLPDLRLPRAAVHTRGDSPLNDSPHQPEHA